LDAEAATGLSEEVADPGANRRSVAERKTERVVETDNEEAKRQARNVDPGMDPVRAGPVAGERKADASDRLRSGERLRRAIEALIRE
jgi:hypothetical protein